MIRLDKKLVVLRAEQEAVREEGEVNEALGQRVAGRVAAAAQPAEASKYRLHVEEVGKITSLLLGLSGRLARAENALYGMPADHADRVSYFIFLVFFVVFFWDLYLCIFPGCWIILIGWRRVYRGFGDSEM